MSKRAGTFVTLREVVDEVGKDVFRFIMLTRRNDQTLDFDFAKVTEQSKDNPVFYVQYAHARAASVMRHAAEQFPRRRSADAALAAAPLDRLADPRGARADPPAGGLAAPRRERRRGARAAPHRLLSAGGRGAVPRAVDQGQGRGDVALHPRRRDPDLTRARLALVRGVAIVIASGLAVFGVEPVEEM